MTPRARSTFRALGWLSITDAWGRIIRGRFLVIAALCVVLAVVSVYRGQLDLRSRGEEASQLIAGRQETTYSSSDRQIQPAFREVRRPEPLSILVRGLEGSVPLAWDFSPSGVYPSGFGSQPESRTWAMSLDLEFIVRILIGLLAVLTAIDSPGAQRGGDALRDLRSLSILPSVVVGSQMIGGLIAMTAINGLVSGAALLAALLRPQILNGGFAAALAGMFLASLAYSLVFYLIGLLVLFSSKNFQSTLTSTVIVWALLALTAPPLVDLLIYGRDAGAPLSADADRQQRFDASIRATEQALGEALVSIAGNPGDRDAALAQPSTRRRLEEIWTQSVERRRRDLYRAPERSITKEEARRFWLGFVSPATSLSSALSRLAGTGAPMADRWSSTILAREDELNRSFFDDPARLGIRIPASSGGEFLSYVRHSPVQASAIPRITISDDTVSQRFVSATGPLFQLWLVVAALAGFLLRRFSVLP